MIRRSITFENKTQMHHNTVLVRLLCSHVYCIVLITMNTSDINSILMTVVGAFVHKIFLLFSQSIQQLRQFWTASTSWDNKWAVFAILVNYFGSYFFVLSARLTDYRLLTSTIVNCQDIIAYINELANSERWDGLVV